MRDRDAVMQTAIENAVENALDNRNIEIARGFKADGVPYNVIAKNTGLTIEQIEEL